MDTQAETSADSGAHAELDASSALMTIIRALKPLEPADRRRTMAAAMTFFADSGDPALVQGDTAVRTSAAADYSAYAPEASRWMQQNNLSQDDVDQIFLFKDGEFDIHGVPGTSKKERTLNTYILTGVGSFLARGDKNFTDAIARGFCQTLGCFDSTNHSTYLKNKGNEIGGDKSKGYGLTAPGMKRGAALIKEFASQFK